MRRFDTFKSKTQGCENPCYHVYIVYEYVKSVYICIERERVCVYVCIQEMYSTQKVDPGHTGWRKFPGLRGLPL